MKFRFPFTYPGGLKIHHRWTSPASESTQPTRLMSPDFFSGQPCKQQQNTTPQQPNEELQAEIGGQRRSHYIRAACLSSKVFFSLDTCDNDSIAFRTRSRWHPERCQVQGVEVRAQNAVIRAMLCAGRNKHSTTPATCRCRRPVAGK